MLAPLLRKNSMLEVAPGLLWSLVIAFAMLGLGSIIRLVSLRWSAPAVTLQRRRSLFVWWILLALLAAALLLGRVGLSILFCTAGLLALREFHELFRRRSSAAPRIAWTVAGIGIGHYLVLALTDWQWSLWAFPILSVALICLPQILAGDTTDYLRTTAGFLWGGVLFFLGLSHVVLMLQLPAAGTSWDIGAAGWPLYVVLLTEIDDIAQALVGRRFGHRSVVPGVSPGKTWEGLIGGLLVTVLLSAALAPRLTSLTDQRTIGEGLAIAIGAGVVISLSGFLGDINMSALKREAQVKDSGSLLPGMGGMIDRVDSLTLAAPAAYYYALALV